MLRSGTNRPEIAGSVLAQLHRHLASSFAIGVALRLVSLRLLLDEDLGDAGHEADFELADPLPDARHPRARDALVEVHDEQLVRYLARLEQADPRVLHELADLSEVCRRVCL